nr:MAG TPA: hypothetical protein [Caudoviricetes sp.]DAQ57293.1 MAG TPA: hypothetical protein [Bacteriophage sp.]
MFRLAIVLSNSAILVLTSEIEMVKVIFCGSPRETSSPSTV